MLSKLSYAGLKTFFDFFMALCLTIPVVAFLAPFVLITGFYTQKRIGINGRDFNVYKLKTMRVAKTPSEEEYKRITRIGSALRRWGVDEMPQLINILKGEMSFVGPRPLPVDYDILITGKYRERFNVKPGITGLAQINGRNSLDWKRKFELDREYISNMSFIFDLRIMLDTVKIVWKGTGVNASKTKTMERFKGFE